MDYKGCANAPLLALQVRKRGQDEQIECLGEGGRLKAYAASDALLVMRPQPLVASSAGESGAASARIAPDLKLQTHADEQVLRLDTQCFESVTVSEDGKTVTVQAREGDVDEVVMCFSSKWSVKRLVAALPSESAPAALKSDSAFSELPLPLPDTAGATNETVGLAQVDGQSGASPLPTTIAAGLKSVCLEMNALYAHRQQVWEEICNYYNDDSSYGVLTQRDHALQCAFQAAQAGASSRVVVGSLLHDIGWKLARRDPTSEAAMTEGAAAAVSQEAPEEDCVAAKLGILHHCLIGKGAGTDQLRAQHDVIGACWLRMRGFHEDVAHVVEGHVLAKRYLCHTEPEYFDKLSAGSKKTLVFQGGPMSVNEKAIFDRDPMQAQCLALRRWDEGAKRPDWKVPGLDTYKSAILGSIVRLNSPPGSRPGTFVRNGNEVVGLVSEIGAAGSEGRESQVIAETDGSLDAEKSSAAQ